MKKFVVLGLFGLLIMAFGAAAYAQDKLEFKASGAFEATSFLYRNIASGQTGDFITTRWPGGSVAAIPPTTYVAGAPGRGFRPYDFTGNQVDMGAWDRTNSYLEYRGILRFDAIMGKGLSGTVIFEMDSSRWGDAGGAAGGLGVWRADQTSVEIKNLYLDVAIPYIGIPAPMTARVGIQSLGARPAMFMITDGAGITGAVKIDPVMIGIQWAKAIEGRDATSDDVDIYGLNVNAKLGTLTPGLFFFYWNMNSYPLQAANLLPNYFTTAPYRANFWWLGAYLDGKLGPLDINFDFVFDYGKVKSRENAMGILAEDAVKYRGFATQLKVNFPWEKFNFGAVGMYASGADMRKTDRLGVPSAMGVADGGTPVGTPKKVGSYVIPPGSEQWAAWGESMIFSNNYITATALPLGMWPSLGTYPLGVNRGAIGGTWVGKIYASVMATPWYKVTLQGLYIGDTTKHGNTLGDAVKVTGRLRDDKSIGFELDLIQDIQIYKNLKWSIGAGILFAGSALDQNCTIPLFNGSPKDPWILATKLRYDF